MFSFIEKRDALTQIIHICADLRETAEVIEEPLLAIILAMAIKQAARARLGDGHTDGILDGG